MRRKGRPKSTKEGKLEQVRLREAEEYRTGMGERAPPRLAQVDIDITLFFASRESIRGTGLDAPRKRCLVPHVGPTRSRFHPVVAFYSNIEFETGHGNSLQARQTS